MPAASLGAPGPPSTLSTVTVRPVAGTFATFCQKYCGAPTSSAARVTMPIVSPDPLAFLYSGSEPVVGGEVGRQEAAWLISADEDAGSRRDCAVERVADERGVVGQPEDGEHVLETPYGRSGAPVAL